MKKIKYLNSSIIFFVTLFICNYSNYSFNHKYLFLIGSGLSLIILSVYRYSISNIDKDTLYIYYLHFINNIITLFSFFYYNLINISLLLMGYNLVILILTIINFYSKKKKKYIFLYFFWYIYLLYNIVKLAF